MLLLAAPVYGLVFALRGPRAFLGADTAVSDLPTTAQAEALANSPIGDAMLNQQDQALLAEPGRIHDARSQEPITVAVVHGAEHMRAVVYGLLNQYGHRPRGGEWLTVYAPRGL